jgi:Protein of unknown function (DUF2845)
MRILDRRKLGAIALAALLFAAAPAHAFRCGSRIVSRGDHVSKLLQFCGEPATVQQRLAQRAFTTDNGRIYAFRGFVEDVLVEDWTYNLGPYQLMRLVRLENGFVVDVKNLGYGY